MRLEHISVKTLFLLVGADTVTSMLTISAALSAMTGDIWVLISGGLLECPCYVGVTLLITFSIGTVCGMAVVRKFNQLGLFGRLTYHFPFAVMMIFAGALLVVYGVFRLMAVRFLQKQSLVDRIKTME